MSDNKDAGQNLNKPNAGLQVTASMANARMPGAAVCQGIIPIRYLSALFCDLVIPTMMEDKRTRTFKGFMKVTKLVKGRYKIKLLEPDPVHGRYPSYIRELGYRMLDAYLYERETYMPYEPTARKAGSVDILKHEHTGDYPRMLKPGTKPEMKHVALKYDQMLTELQERWVLRHDASLPKEDIWSSRWEVYDLYGGRNPHWCKLPTFYRQELEHSRPLAYMCRVINRRYYSTRKIMGGFASNNPLGPQYHLSAFCYLWAQGLIEHAQYGMWLKMHNKLYLSKKTQVAYCKKRDALILEPR